MTRRDQLRILQRLHGCAEIAEYRDLVPHHSDVDMKIAAIARQSMMLFHSLVGLFPHNVSMVELNTDTPSQRIAQGLKENAVYWKE